MPETLSEIGDDTEVQFEAEDNDKKPPSTPVIAKVGPSLGVGHVMPTSTAPASTSS